jgi:hypothetical protein
VSKYDMQSGRRCQEKIYLFGGRGVGRQSAGPADISDRCSHGYVVIEKLLQRLTTDLLQAQL